ncbi:glycoside hydrolase family 78 protein [Amycolatopsis sp. YIM 10]|uniref:glycoside hydrolase family 78 protein n=1 Tax=Amycolatopsis sp. YIM 10 TaxID=2653857 RepID=UPI0012906818|nr:glycoside hydrolase family 78 protein [Amycolatopsis sp. YIM 10]QFU92544.1 Bacterial alpha-L-rhamnosidase [Amycolatopsis sp. YIM 10]
MDHPWHATFIAPPASDGAAPYFRREFDAAECRRATLHVTGLGIVEPYLNGVRVGDEVLVPGWTSYRHRLHVSRHDVTELVRAGANAVGAIVGDGWAVGRIGYEGKRHHYADRPALFLQLELDYRDRVEIVSTAEGFRCGTGAVLQGDLLDGETYDARLEPEGWNLPGFDDRAWAPAARFDWALDALVSTGAPPIRRIEELAPVSVTTSPSAKTIVDFGQNIAGWTRITTSGPAGATITLRHAEVLTGGELDTATLRTAAATDRYTCRGDGSEIWEPRFTFHGFRYAEVDGPFDEIRAVVVHSDMTRTGWFDSSHELLNRLHANVVWSMRGNFVGIPTDCPQRDERLGWTGDINAFGPTAAFLYDARGVLGSWLADLAAEQRDKGYVPMVVPDVLSTPSPPTALWSDTAVSLPWALYQEYGDEEILRSQYESMASFVRDVEGRLDERGLWSSGYQFGDWLAPDAPDDDAGGSKTDRYLVASAFLCRVTAEMAGTAAVLGKDEDARHFTALAERVRAAFRREYVTAAGRIVSETVTAYALAICFGTLAPDQEAHAGHQLTRLVTKAGYRISTGFAGTPYVCEALSRTDHLDEAYQVLLETGCPSFLYPVTMGATTIWERWDAIRPDGTLHPSGLGSHNHYALGAVANWLHRVVGGLTPVEPGYRTMRIAPRPGGDLTHATLAHDTVHGRVTIAWRVLDGRLRLDVTIPEDTSATVMLPLHPDGLSEEIRGGEHTWEYGLPQPLRRAYTMDTPLQTIAADPKAWRAVTTVFGKHFPGIPIDGSAPGVSLNTVLEYFPEMPTGLKADLVAAIGVDEDSRGRESAPSGG